jgi:hypothetical protein
MSARSVRDHGIRIFLGVDVALLQCGVDILEVHRHHVCAEGAKSRHVNLAWLYANFEIPEVVDRHDRPLGIGHVPRAKCHPAERKEPFRHKLRFDELADVAVDHAAGVIGILEHERQVQRLGL